MLVLLHRRQLEERARMESGTGQSGLQLTEKNQEQVLDAPDVVNHTPGPSGGELQTMRQESQDEAAACIKEYREASVEELSLQFQDCLQQVEMLFAGCTEDMKPRLEGSLEDLNVQLEESMRELGAWLQESAECPQEETCLAELGARFEKSIADVKQLERRRDELVQELLQLEEPMAQQVQELRAELQQASGQLDRAELQRRRVLLEVHGVRRRLFVTIHGCTKSQVCLETQRREMEESAITQNKLEEQLALLTEEASAVRQAHQNQLNNLQSQLAGLGRVRAPEGPSQSRRASGELQDVLRRGVQELQGFYEPRLRALLKMRRTGTEATSRAWEQARELRAQLGPLREEVQRLSQNKACMQERIAMIQRDREENLEQYREMLDTLEERCREMKTELQVQKMRNQEAEMAKRSLEKELELYRSALQSLAQDSPAAAKDET